MNATFSAAGVDAPQPRQQFVQDSHRANRCSPRASMSTPPKTPPAPATYVLEGAHDRPELRGHRFIGKLPRCGLGHAEVDDLGHSSAVDDRDENIGGLEIAVDDALVMRVLHRLADRYKQFEPLLGREPGLIVNFVSGKPLTSSMTKNGWPLGVRPPSRTRAMLG